MNRKSIALLVAAVASFVTGSVVQYLQYVHGNPTAEIFFSFISMLPVFAWFRFDTDQRSYRRTPLLNICVLAIAIVALPYYFFRSRGLRGGFIACGLFTLAVICSIALTIAGQYATYFAMQS